MYFRFGGLNMQSSVGAWVCLSFCLIASCPSIETRTFSENSETSSEEVFDDNYNESDEDEEEIADGIDTKYFHKLESHNQDDEADVDETETYDSNPISPENDDETETDDEEPITPKKKNKLKRRKNLD